jgi:hypothetical protein
VLHPRGSSGGVPLATSVVPSPSLQVGLLRCYANAKAGKHHLPFLREPNNDQQASSPFPASPAQARLGQELSQNSLRVKSLHQPARGCVDMAKPAVAKFAAPCIEETRRGKPVITSYVVDTCSITYAHAKLKISGQILALGSIETRCKEGRSAGRKASVPCSCSCSSILPTFAVANEQESRDSTASIGTVHFFYIWSFLFQRTKSHPSRFWRCRSRRHATTLSNAQSISPPPPTPPRP